MCGPTLTSHPRDPIGEDGRGMETRGVEGDGNKGNRADGEERERRGKEVSEVRRGHLKLKTNVAESQSEEALGSIQDASILGNCVINNLNR